MHGELDDLPRSGVENVRGIGVHERRVVHEAVLRDDLRRAPPRLPAGAAEALDVSAETLEGGERALEVGALLLLRLGERRIVRVGVMPDLMPRREDRLDGSGVPVCGPA